jgi:oligosaccharide repeat unit polymerase
MLTVSIFALSLAGLILLECFLRGSDFFSPVRVYVFFHSLALGIAFLALDPRMTPFNPLTSLVYFSSAACFVLGAWSARMTGRLSGEERAPFDFKHYNWNVHFLFSFALFLFFLGGMAGAYLGTGMFPMFAENKTKAIAVFHAYSWPTSIAFNMGIPTAVLFSIYSYRPRKGSRWLNPGIWMVVLTVGIFSMAMSRSGLMIFAAFALVFYNYARRRVTIGRLFFFFVIFATLIIYSGYVKMNGYRDQYNLKSTVKTSDLVAIALLVPYQYIANNFWNLDHALNPPADRLGHPTTYGINTMAGYLAGLAVPGGNVGIVLHKELGIDNEYNKTSVKVKNLNTISYQWAVYKDFGLAGVLVAPFLIGAFFSILYRKVRLTPNLLNVAVYSYFVFFIATSFGGYFPENVIFVWGLVYLTLCGYISLWMGGGTRLQEGPRPPAG